MIIKDNKIYFYSNVEKIKKLPNKTFLMLFDSDREEYYLSEIGSSTLPSKIYGKDELFCDRVLNTYNKTDRNLGVLLTGLKGTGKSMVAKMIAQKAKMPVVCITSPFNGDKFADCLDKMGDDVILFFDEFEKVYKDENEQKQFLSILDGTFSSKKLFLFTTNHFEINEFLKSRPSRIRYVRQFDGLDKETIQEVIDDLLENKEYEKELKDVLEILSTVSIDVLLHFIDEINMYNEPPRVAIKNMNIQIEHSYFDVRLYIKGTLYHSKVNYNPLASKRVTVSYKYFDDSEYNRERWGYYSKDLEELTFQVIDGGEFQFRDRDGNKIIFSPSKPYGFEI
jgi:hypothetical protein|nr:MAG TPA: Bacterial dnaA protein [Caudoviricetes sp.]